MEKAEKTLWWARLLNGLADDELEHLDSEGLKNVAFELQELSEELKRIAERCSQSGTEYSEH